MYFVNEYSDFIYLTVTIVYFNMSNFEWIGSKITCYNPNFHEGFFDFYESFLLNQIEYRVGQFALFKQEDDHRIGRLLSIYHSRKDIIKYKGCVQWYSWARHVVPKIKGNTIEYDEDNEVVAEIEATNSVVNLPDIQMKCEVIFCTLSDPIHLIKHDKFDPKVHYSCRYKLDRGQLSPYFDCDVLKNIINLDSVNIELNERMKEKTPVKIDKVNKRKSSVAPVTVINLVSDETDEEEDRVKSPLNTFKNIKLTLGSDKKSANALNVSNTTNVKRVLNDTFSSPSGIPIFSCSILSPENINGVKMKFKMTDNKNGLLQVVSKQLDNKVLQMKSPIKMKDLEDGKLLEYAWDKHSKKNVTPATIEGRRRSSRTVERKSYAEFSPRERNTPKKRVCRGDFSVPVIKLTRNILCKVNKGDELELTNLIEKETSHNTCSSKRISDSTLKRSERNASRTIDYFESLDAVEVDSNDSSHENDESKSNVHTPSTTSLRERMIRSCGMPRRFEYTEEDSPLRCRTRTRSAKNIIGSNIKKNATIDSAGKGNVPVSETAKKTIKPKTTEVSGIIQGLITSGNAKTIEVSKTMGVSKTKRDHVNGTKKVYTPDEIEMTPKKNDVLKNTVKNFKCLNDDEGDDFVKTPRRRVTLCTPKKDTPSSRARMIRDGVITPSVQLRGKAVIKDSTPLSKARSQLHVSFVPKSLPCREKEFADVLNFLEGKLFDGCGGCMYISGVPGTGKTATVTEVIRTLTETAANKDVPTFKYININGMKLSEPRQSYVEIVKQLTGRSIHWEEARALLESKFINPKKKSLPIILVIDELDILCTKRQDVVYNLLDWPTKANAQLIVVTIANTMDLPERLLMGRVTSRLGLTRLTFKAYNHKQLQEIVSKRLSGISAFNPDAIQLVARKVASVSGDARRALDICRRAVEIAELEGKSTLVSMVHVNHALTAMITQPKVQAIKHCSRLQKLILQAVVAEVERTGVEETNFGCVLKMLVPIAALDGFQMVSSTVAMAVTAQLGACRLLLIDQKTNTMYSKIILNVSADDVYYALTKTSI